MKCGVCGAEMRSLSTSLPFKTSEISIVVVRDVPVLQCTACREYLLEDPILDKVEKILERVDTSAELEVVHYAA